MLRCTPVNLIIAGAFALARPVCAQDMIGPIFPAAPVTTAESSPGLTEGVSSDIELLPLGAPAEPALIPRSGDAPGSIGQVDAGDAGSVGGWWRSIGALGLVVAVILLLAGVLKRLALRSGTLGAAFGAGGRAPSGLLQVLGRYPVGRGQTLVLLKLDRRVLLLCQTVGAKGAGMRTLCELTEPEEVASVLMLAADSEGRSLNARFKDMVDGFESDHRQAQAHTQHQSQAQMAGLSGQSAPSGVDPVGVLSSRLESLRRNTIEVSA